MANAKSNPKNRLRTHKKPADAQHPNELYKFLNGPLETRFSLSLRMTSSCNERKLIALITPLGSIYKCHRHLMEGLEHQLKLFHNTKPSMVVVERQKKMHALCRHHVHHTNISLAANAIRIENVFGSQQNKHCLKSFNEHRANSLNIQHAPYQKHAFWINWKKN